MLGAETLPRTQLTCTAPSGPISWRCCRKTRLGWSGEYASRRDASIAAAADAASRASTSAWSPRRAARAQRVPLCIM